MRQSPTIVDLIQRRSRELDKTIESTLACAGFSELERLPTGAAKLIPCRLRELQSMIAALQVDMACLVVASRAGLTPAMDSQTAP